MCIQEEGSTVTLIFYAPRIYMHVVSYVPKHDWLLKPSSPMCLGKQGPHVLGTSLQGRLLSVMQSGAPEHTVTQANLGSAYCLYNLDFNIHMHSELPAPSSPTYPSRHEPQVCSGVVREHSSRPIESQSGTSVQSKCV